ncbi:MAG: hypothetical protein NC300_05775 [Bacteroidales bacterium]|nr:hypothetical protein [Clostridium sp.]MCM1203631.1 hypothetical protein [Bacteroidales bacterium]
MLKQYLRKRRADKEKAREYQPIQSEWIGYEAEKLVKIIYKAQKDKRKMSEWREVLEKILFTLSPYYDSLTDIQHRSVYKRNKMLTPMLSIRQMSTYYAVISELLHGNSFAALHEWIDFILDYGKYKGKELSEIETYLIYVSGQQIVELIRLEEKE